MVGVVLSYVYRRRPARAHLILVCAMVAGLAMPLLTSAARHCGWGLFAVSEPADVRVDSNRAERSSTVQGRVTESFFPVVAEQQEASPAVSAQESKTPVLRTGLATATGKPKKGLEISWGTICKWGWIALVGAVSLKLLIAVLSGLRLLRRACPAANDGVRQLGPEAARLGLKNTLKVRVSDSVTCPAIWCWRRKPILLLPSVTQLTAPVDWGSVIEHELAHWKRRDHLTDLLAEILVCLVPWHPLVWWVRRRLEHLSELACDDWVLAAQAEPEAYAGSLLRFVHKPEVVLAQGVTSDGKRLKSRVRRILGSRRVDPRPGVRWSLAAAVVTACMVTFLTLAQARIQPIVQKIGFRTMLFPRGQLLGQVYMRFWGPGPNGLWVVNSWKPLRAASGTVEVPPNKQLMLKVSDEASSDLSWIEHLEPKELLSALWLSSPRMGDAELVHLERLQLLAELRLHSNGISDAGLRHLQGLRSLQKLQLFSTGITDAGLAYLQGLPALRILDLRGTRISGEGLAHLSELKSIRILNLSGTNVSDEGLAHLKKLPALRWLFLDRTQVSDAGLVHIGQLAWLHGVSLNDTDITSGGLADLAKLTSLWSLGLCGTKVDNAGLAFLTGMSSLRRLNLRNTEVSDEGLAHIKKLTSLRQLLVEGTRISNAGLKELKQALPSCRFTVGHL